jgi:acyl carrier protein
MMENEIRNQVLLLIRDKLQRLAIKENELGGNFDLVKSGLLNSLEFVDLVASLEKLYQVEIDFEAALDTGDLTTIAGLTRAFKAKE